MIKKLNIKMFISMFLLVIITVITSSCFAAQLNLCDYDGPDISNFVSVAAENNFDVQNSKKVILKNTINENNISYQVYFFKFNEEVKFVYNRVVNDIFYEYVVLNGNNEEITDGNFDFFMVEFSNDTYSFRNYNNLNPWKASACLQLNNSFLICNNTEFDFYDNDVKFHNAYKSKYIFASYEFQTDSSAKVKFTLNKELSNYTLKYSLTGVEPNVSLTEPVKLRNPIIYNIGTSNLVVKPNSKVYYALYDSSGKCLEQDVLTIPEYDVVHENSDKDIDYEIEYNSDNTEATIYASITNGEFSDKLYYSYYPPNLNGDYDAKLGFPRSGLKITKNCDIHLIATDAFDNVFTADYVTINKLGTIPEDLFKVNVLTEEKTVLLYPRLYGLDFDKYYIEASANLDHFSSSDKVNFYINNDKKGDVKGLNGQYFQFGSDSELKFYQSVGTSEITVTFLVKNEETNAVCITRTVSFKIGLEGKNDTGVIGSTTNGSYDDSFIISDGSNVVKSIESMTLKDYYDLVDTGNSAWYFFKVILNNLPRWLTLPLSLLVFGVVVITLYRFIRGA